MKKFLLITCVLVKTSFILTAQVTTDANGNVGISTSVPNQKLHITGDNAKIRIADTKYDVGNLGIEFWHRIPGDAVLPKTAIISSGTLGYGISDLRFVINAVGNNNGYDINNDTRLIIKSNGNVGIGTTNPKSQLQLGNFSRIGTEFNNTYLSRGWYYEAGANKTNDPNPSLVGVQSDGIAFFTDANVPVNTAYTPTPRMFVRNDGNVGISTASPAAKLHIGAPLSGQSAIKLGVLGDMGNANTAVGASPGGYNIDFQGYRDIAQDQIGARIRGERINVYQSNNPLLQQMDLAFYTSTGGDATQLTEKLRIKSTGDVIVGSAITRCKIGVGITPTSVLHVATTGNAGDDAYIQIQRRDANDGTMGLALQPSGTITDINKSWGYGVWGKTNDLRIWNYNGVDNFIKLAILSSNGNVGIGTSLPTEKLSVNGTVLAKKVRVSVKPEDWPDYVFDKNYKLRPLSSLETFINEQHHLPDVPSAEKVEKDGLDIGSAQAALLRKVEELTLYMIDQSKKMKALEEEIAALKSNNK